MVDDDRSARDDGRVWGWMDDGVFRPLPKGPMLTDGMGPPPFDVTGSFGVRRVVHDPMEVAL